MSAIRIAQRLSHSAWIKPLSSQISLIQNRNASSTTNDWKQVYKFPFIRGLAAFQKWVICPFKLRIMSCRFTYFRLKIYQLSFTILVTPTCYILEQFSDQLPAQTWIVALYIGISGTFTLAAASQAFKNTVGFIYMSNENPDMLKFSFMDFWGKRCDKQIELHEVMPFTELPGKSLTNALFTGLRFYNNEMPQLKLVHKHGGISDLDGFTRIFGPTE